MALNAPALREKQQCFRFHAKAEAASGTIGTPPSSSLRVLV
jgi:hypothetical protein